VPASSDSGDLLLDQKQYGDKFTDHLLEQYKLYVESADKISDRRSLSNNFFLSINAVLLSGIGVALGTQTRGTSIFPIFTSLSGILFCIAWVQMVKSYRNLNRAKFEVIQEMERVLPAKMFTVEWTKFKSRDAVERSKELTDVEKIVPLMFILCYLILGVLFGVSFLV
jgi:hypothetical protein